MLRLPMLRLPMLRVSTLRLPMPIWFLERFSCRRFLTPAGAPKSSSAVGRGGQGRGEWEKGRGMRVVVAVGNYSIARVIFAVVDG